MLPHMSQWWATQHEGDMTQEQFTEKRCILISFGFFFGVCKEKLRDQSIHRKKVERNINEERAPLQF